MNEKISAYLVARNAEITALVSDNNLVSDPSPLSRAVKTLIDPPIEPKCAFTHKSLEGQVVKAFLKRFQPSKLGISPNPRHLQPRAAQRPDTRALRRLPCRTAPQPA